MKNARNSRSPRLELLGKDPPRQCDVRIADVQSVGVRIVNNDTTEHVRMDLAHKYIQAGGLQGHFMIVEICRVLVDCFPIHCG